MKRNELSGEIMVNLYITATTVIPSRFAYLDIAYHSSI